MSILNKIFKGKNEIWSYRYQNYEIMITMKHSSFAKASKVCLYIDGEKVNEGILRFTCYLEGTLSNGEFVFTILHAGLDDVQCNMLVGKKPILKRHGKNISDNEVDTFATMGLLSAEFHQLPDHRHKPIPPGRKE